MRYTKITKNSARFMSDERVFSKAITRAVNTLSSVYESKIAEDDFFAAAEIFIDLNCPPQERYLQMQKVIETFEAELKAAEKELLK